MELPLTKSPFGMFKWLFSFCRYPSRLNAAPTVCDLSLVLEHGKKTALVGKPGSGKSTIVQLLQRFYRPQSGQILIGEVEDHTISPLAMRSTIGIVSQDPILFDDSIFINVALGATDPSSVTMEVVANACRIANAHTFILGLPQGYFTRVGPGGSLLSGGQRQRIAIARALMRDPSLLILDEATSSLDSTSEAAIQDALEMASKGRTTIVIAHRLSSVISADKVIVLQDGQIAQQGTHAELIGDANGLYFGLVHVQQESPTVLLEDENIPMDERHEDTTILDNRTEFEIMASSSSFGPSPADPSISAATAVCTMPFSRTIYRILNLQAPDFIFLVFGFLCALVNGAVMPIFSIFFAGFQSVLAEPLIELLKKGVFFYALFFIIQGLVCGISQFGQIAFFGIAGQRLTTRLRTSCFKSLLLMDQNHPLRMGYFDELQNSPARLTIRLSSDADALQKLTGPLFGNLMQGLVTVVMGLLIALYSGYKLALILLLVMPLMGIFGFFQMKIITHFSENAKLSSEPAQARMREALQHRRTVSVLCCESWFLNQYRMELANAHRHSVISAFLGAIGFGFSQAMLCWVYALSFYFGSRLLLAGELDYASMNRVLYSILFCAMTARQTLSHLPDISSSRMAAESIFELLSYDKTAKKEASTLDKKSEIIPTISQEHHPQIQLKNIRFSYPSRPENRVLDDVDLTFEVGKRIAIVGPSGSGKSSIFGLLERFYEPQGGSILFDGKDISTLSLSAVRRTFGLVGQNPILFSRSISDNISLGVDGDSKRATAKKGIERSPSPFRPSQMDIEKASILAGIHSEITSLPQGYGTQVGEFGSQLSGGQRQRVAIARALVRQPAILLFDEVTSSLDSQSEKKIQTALTEYFASSGDGASKTCVVISHRLSTIQDFDLIYVMNKGKVVEIGNHSSLLSKRGLYYKLFKKQSREVH